MVSNQVPVPPDVSQEFTAIAHGSRLAKYMLDLCGDPVSNSNFQQVNELYPYEKVSDRARHYLNAALEHMLFWADLAAPFKFHSEQTVTFTLRPSLALARAALESSAQAVWLMDTVDPLECVRRHLSLIRWDLAAHRKSYLDQSSKDRVKQRDTQLLTRIQRVFDEEQVAPPRGYLHIIQEACKPSDLRINAEDTERLWRAMSGAAHGMYWTNLDLTQVEVGEEYEEGQYRTIAYPDPAAMVASLDTSLAMAQYGVLKYLHYAGADIAELQDTASRQLAQEVPFKPDADPDIVEKILGERPSTLRET